MAVTLRQMQAFLAVVELGSFTKAAERVGVAQPALSQMVRDLERELGIRLLDRTTRRIELTQGGREFQVSSVKILLDVEAAVRSAAEVAGRRRGRVVVAAPPLLSAGLLPGVIAELYQRFPGITVTLLDLRTDDIVDAVRLGQADCGLGTFRTTEDGVDRIPLTRDGLVLFCRSDHALTSRSVVRWSDLAGEPLVTLTRDSGIRLLVEVGFEAAQIPLHPTFEVSLITTALAFVAAGHGVAVLPTYACAALPKEGLSIRPMVEPSIVRDIVLIRGQGRTPSPAAAALELVLRNRIRGFEQIALASGTM